MITIQKTFLGLINISFRLLLFFVISALTFVTLYADQNYLKELLQKSGAYNKFVPSLIESAKDQKLSENSEMTLSTPEIKQIITESFPPEVLQKNIEGLVDNTYSWLNEDSEELKFTVDLEESQNTLNTRLSVFTFNYYKSLPECEADVLTEIDPLGATCKSPYINEEQMRQNIFESYQKNNILLEDPVLTEKDLFKDNSIEKYSAFPLYFGLIKPALIFLVILLLLLGLMIVFLSKNITTGIRKIGNMLVISAGGLIIFTLVFSYVIPKLTGSLPVFKGSGEGIDSLLNSLSIIISRDYALNTIKVCLPIVAIGLILLLFVKATKPSKYSGIRKKAGLENANEIKPKSGKALRSDPPIQSSEISKSKKPRIKKSAKYRKIPKREM